MGRRDQVRGERVAQLIAGFDRYLSAFAADTPFTRLGQWEGHIETIDRRRAAGGVAEAVADPVFVETLWNTLQAWGIGRRASRLAPLEEFAGELRRWSSTLQALDGVRLPDADDSDHQAVWELAQNLDVIDNRARVVALTKTLHHLLPDLVVPIDRAYTGTFFAWNVAEFQNRQQEIFDGCWDAFTRIAHSVDLDRHVGTAPWNTSITKVVDNAIVGYCLAEGLTEGRDEAPPRSPRSHPEPVGRPRRPSWTIEELEADIEAFAAELRAAGLRDSTVDTYLGRSETFVRWLAGRYTPRGPNS